MKKIFLLLLTLISFVSCEIGETTNDTEKPNIILIMSDDMGYSDIGCYGGVIDTPNLDALAENGLRFTQFYNTARCCPTRASLLTGLYPHQAGIGHMMRDWNRESYRGDLSKNAVTISEVLKEAGYATYMSGKWHVTPYDKNKTSKHNWPLQRGFEKFFGTIHGAGSLFDPNSLVRDNEYISPDKDFYYTDAISDQASEYIEQHEGDAPFFMYISYTAAHWPMHAKPEDIEKYKGKFDEGWDVLREEKSKRMKAMGLIKPEWKLSDKENIMDWKDTGMKTWYSRLMEVYAAMVDNMDQGIGRVVNTLKKKGIKDNTLIFFLQDNGGCAEQFGFSDTIRPYHKDVRMDDFKPMKEGEIQTEMVPKYTREGKPVLVGKGLNPGPADTYLGYGAPWANASNTPFRLYKHWVHEGGISTPLIVHWPNGIKSKNEFRNQPGHLIDIMATCIDVAEIPYPETYKNNPIKPLAGVSLSLAFNNEQPETRPIFWEHEGNKAVRFENYKLVSDWRWDKETTWELYDLEKDRTESNNLASKMPEKVEELSRLYQKWATDNKVILWSDRKKILAEQ